MKVKIGYAYFYDGDADKAVMVVVKDNKKVEYIFSDGNGRLVLSTASKKYFKKHYKAHNIKVTGFRFVQNESEQ